MGLVVLVLSIELVFSYASKIGYNNTQGAFPIWVLLNYQILAPSIWLFIKYNTDDNFSFQKWHLLLYLPAVLESGIQIYVLQNSVVIESFLWEAFTEYLPMVAFIAAIAYFWYSYFKLNQSKAFKSERKIWLTQVRLLLLMSSLTLVGVFWLVFSFIGWAHFSYIEIALMVLVFGMAFLMFLETQTFPTVVKVDKNTEFPHYDDKQQLERLTQTLSENKPYLKPNLPLKELSAELALPYRYVSYLINHYHNKNYKEFINEYRIDTFLTKAKSGQEDHKTLLALAMESGFSSKSTFNQVFKNHLGKTPSEYLN